MALGKPHGKAKVYKLADVLQRVAYLQAQANEKHETAPARYTVVLSKANSMYASPLT